MSLVNRELYVALLAAGVPADTARTAAAVDVQSPEDPMDEPRGDTGRAEWAALRAEIRRDFTTVKWMMAAALALEIG